MAERGGWAPFRQDLAASWRAWTHEPVIPLVSAGLALLSLVPDPWIILTLPAAIFGIGWLGTERLFYLRAFRGLPLLPSERRRFTWAFVGRFGSLGVLVLIPTISVLFLLVRVEGNLARWAIVTGVALVIDVLLTFVTPALAYSTRRVSIAARMGHRTLVDHWPASAPYALVPPMAWMAALRFLPRSAVGLLGQIGLTAVGALVYLWFKGAVAAFYLRHHQVGDDGAVDASHIQILDHRMREHFRPDDPA